MNKFEFDPKKYKKELTGILNEIQELILDHGGASHGMHPQSFKQIEKILRKYPKDGNKIFSKDELIRGITFFAQNFVGAGHCPAPTKRIDEIISFLKMKPTRTISGVTTVTVLTKPWMCPGNCIFCPNDIRMPKSYIANEPGAQRALTNRFDPYFQVFNRLKALQNIGHPTDKIELLVLGGSWSAYPEKYQIWFIKECFRAMNEFNNTVGAADLLHPTQTPDDDINDEIRKKYSDLPYNKLISTKEYKEKFIKFNVIDGENVGAADLLHPQKILEIQTIWKYLQHQQEINSHGKTRCVGLVLETRPDLITPKEVLRMRRLGATKVQLGVQILNDKVSKLNKRGEKTSDTSNAFALLRSAGFKIHAHMMPNLFGAKPQDDINSYKDLFELPDFKPDEIKIYPTSVIKNTELYDLYVKGEFKPYEQYELDEMLIEMIRLTPEYCRISRMIRDIPSTEIEAGNLKTNLRQTIEGKIQKTNIQNLNIRAREIKGEKVTLKDLKLDIIKYKTSNSDEYFLQYITKERKIAGFLRLSLPNLTPSPSPSIDGEGGQRPGEVNPVTSELDDCAIIREVHVYGPSLELKIDSKGEAQHLGLGTKLIERAKEIANEKGFKKLAVISSIGTREYYEKRGFTLHELYQITSI